MKIHILTNALDYGDAVSTHCILLKKRAYEIGIEAELYAEFSDDRVREHATPVSQLAAAASPDDLLLHQLFNDTALMRYVEDFPGRRILMYHNITPPEYFPKGSPVYDSCVGGLRLVGSLTGLYHYALGMSEFSRSDLDVMGYPRTGVFPLFTDLDRLESLLPDASLVNRRWQEGTTFLFVGRVAPNKGVGDLFHFLSAYKRMGEAARLIIAGDDQQHPAYTDELLQVAGRLELRLGEDVVFTGKIPDSQLVAWYRCSDAFISFSEHEGFCAPLVESMLFGLPVFAFAAGAVEGTLGGAGVLLRSKDFEVESGQVRGVLADREQTASVVAVQKRRVEAFSATAQRAALGALVNSFDQFAIQGRASPRVSVVINTYNRARHLETCLSTLRRQTYRNFEVVIVNGPSTDDTATVLRQFQGEIRVAETGSRVLAVSRNIGIQASRGEIVAFIDDDAIADPHWLEEIVRPFDDANVGGAGGLVYRMNGREVEFRNGIIDMEGFVLWNEPSPGRHWGWQSGYLNTVSGNNCAFRRSALEKIGGFDERIEYYHDEADVVIRLQTNGFRVVHWSNAVVYHEGAVSQNRSGKYALNWASICKNTVYCALKNYSGPVSRRRMARRIAWRVVRERMADILHWWTSGKIGTGEFTRMESACVTGIIAGIRRGLDPQPIYRNIPPVSTDSEFLPYFIATGSQLSICLLAQSLPDQSSNGIGTYTLNLAQGLRSLGYHMHIISQADSWSSDLKDGIWFHTAPNLPLHNKVLDSAVYPTTGKNLSYSNGVRTKLLDIESRWGLDVVESPNWDTEGLLTALEHRVPVVVRAHSPMFKVAETQGWEMTSDLQLCSSLEGLLMRHADVVSGSTVALLNLIETRFNVGAKKALVPLGLDIAAPVEARTSPGCKKVLFVGRLERRKGIHTLLEAIPEVLRVSEGVEFEIAGMDSHSEHGQTWKEFWNERSDQWKNRVHFHGEVTQIQLSRLYEDCAVFVAPSLYESFGLIYLEAMAFGKPVIGCRTGGIPEVVVDEKTGILVPPGDATALSNAILDLVNDDALASRLGTAGRERYLECFTSAAMARRSAELYGRVSYNQKLLGTVVWCGLAMDFKREPESRILWHSQNQQVFLLIEKGNARTPVYGPYINLQKGTYRAEFKLWVESVTATAGRFGSVDVFSMSAGTLGERAFGTVDFAAGPGCVLDVYFTVADSSAGDYEFRLHTAGVASIYLRQIVVSRWPPRGIFQNSVSAAESAPIEHAADLAL